MFAARGLHVCYMFASCSSFLLARIPMFAALFVCYNVCSGAKSVIGQIMHDCPFNVCCQTDIVIGRGLRRFFRQNSLESRISVERKIPDRVACVFALCFMHGPILSLAVFDTCRLSVSYPYNTRLRNLTLKCLLHPDSKHQRRLTNVWFDEYCSHAPRLLCFICM